jgi:hypothetical protein
VAWRSETTTASQMIGMETVVAVVVPGMAGLLLLLPQARHQLLELGAAFETMK